MATSPQRSDLAKALEGAVKSFASFLKEQTKETWKVDGLTLTSKIGVVLLTFPPPVGPVGEEAAEQVEGYVHLQLPGRQEKSFRGRITIREMQEPTQSSTATHLVRAITGTEGSPMSLRASLIRLASEHPEFRKDLLPLLASEKSAGCEKLPEGGMRENCEKKKEEGAKSKTAGSAMLRTMIGVRVRTFGTKRVPGRGGPDEIHVSGIMSINTGSPSDDVAPLKFEAVCQTYGEDGTIKVVDFQSHKAVTGAGSEGLLQFYRVLFSRAVSENRAQLLGHAGDSSELYSSETGLPTGGGGEFPRRLVIE